MFQLRQSLLLFLTATIWGSGFVAQSIGMDHVTPFTYTFFRTLIGGLVLIPVIFYLKRKYARETQNQAKDSKRPLDYNSKKNLLIGSLVCGIFLIGGESFQQFGLVTTDAGKTGFITSMYVVFVPIIGLFLGKKLNAGIVIGVVLSIVGLYLLCIKPQLNEASTGFLGGLTIETGDLQILVAAVIFSFHILCIDHFVPKCDGVYLACGQFFAASFYGLVLMLSFDYDVFAWEDVYAASLALLWSGVMSNGVAYTLQVVGQRGMHPTIATLILSLESVMAVVFGTLLLNEVLSLREAIGCFLLLLAVIIAQVNLKYILAFFSKKEKIIENNKLSKSSTSAESS